ncbi:MAG: hypothetical protein K6F10_01925 [Paludibacteraceae bacterium]|nr:hypothetical protein [Paludibacteraceae bacterium]
MKTLRYLLIALAMASFLSGNAQSFASQPGTQMAEDIVVSAPGQVSSGGLQSRSGRSITPVAVKSTRKTTMSSSSGSSASPMFTSTSRLKSGSGMSGGGFSGGASAGGLMSSGSRYSSVAAGGGGSAGGSVSAAGGPRKIGGGNSGGGDPGPENPDDPWATPLGDVLWPMMALACAYALARAFLKYLLYRKKQ